MKIDRRKLSWLYVWIGISAWIMTSLHLGSYLDSGLLKGLTAFAADGLINTNEASKFLAIDILMLGLAILIWMLFEAHRLQIPYVTAYVLVSILIGVSLAVPLFLAHRERVIAVNCAETPQLELPA